ncbi:Rv3235 family protein [Actinomyces sp. 2119]|uniref:Rv3235 family protein n=1 Tax=Actinomyces sp. 2119 TaxID=2321393 RepID=UPI001C717C7D|nr:Rv3235 family protein [Actinomyces sp. 2119]
MATDTATTARKADAVGPSGPRTSTHPRPTRPTPGRPATGRPPGTVASTPPPGTTRGTRAGDLLSFSPRLPPETTTMRTAASTVPTVSRTPRRRRPTPGTTGAPQQQPPPSPARTAATVVTAAAEVLMGSRPVDHLARWTTPALFRALSRRAGLASRVLGPGRRRARPRTRSVRTQATLHGACEATVLIEDGERVRAAAARLEPLHGQWVLTNLEIA